MNRIATIITMDACCVRVLLQNSGASCEIGFLFTFVHTSCFVRWFMKLVWTSELKSVYVHCRNNVFNNTILMIFYMSCVFSFGWFMIFSAAYVSALKIFSNKDKVTVINNFKGYDYFVLLTRISLYYTKDGQFFIFLSGTRIYFFCVKLYT